MADEDDSKSDETSANQDIVYNWTDITKEFFASCAGLKLGELMHDSK